MPRWRHYSRKHRAMLLRHDAALAAIRQNPDMPEDDRLDLLLSVVAPGSGLLRASLLALARGKR